MHDQIDRFRDSLQARRLSPGTVRPYSSELHRLADYLETQGVLLDDVTQHHVTRYAARSDCASATANRQLVVFRQFFAWLGHPVARSLSGLRAPRVERPVPEFLTADEEKRLRKTLQVRSDQRHQGRDRTLLCLLLDTGLRVAEAVGLSVGDLNLAGKRLTVLAKGRKRRAKFLTAETRELLASLVDGRPAKAPVFVSGQGRRLCDRQVRRIVENWARLAGIDKPVHPHTLRHTFATSLLARTGNLRLVQRALDHESPQTTAIYAHVVDDELQAAMEARSEAGPTIRTADLAC